MYFRVVVKDPTGDKITSHLLDILHRVGGGDLPLPDSRLDYYMGDGKFWFTVKGWNLIGVKLYGLAIRSGKNSVELFVTKNPGTIIYEDEYQVVAEEG